jgi:hypothetical protein
VATPNANTEAIGDQVVSFLTALTYPSTSTIVYAQAQLEAIKDVIDLTANGSICVEVYGDQDTSERRGFGGRIWDEQTWLILSLCSLDTPVLAKQIYSVRDALVFPFQQHATLGTAVFNLFHSQLNNNMKFGRVFRNGTWLRSHLAVLTTKQEWQVIGGIQS